MVIASAHKWFEANGHEPMAAGGSFQEKLLARSLKALREQANDSLGQYDEKLCEDFAQFRPLFAQIHHDLKTGKRQLLRISKTTNLQEGRFYLVEGQMVYLVSILEKRRGTNGLQDGRTRCIASR